MKKKSILFALAAVCLPLALSAQKEREITLNEAIAMARIQSVDAAVALNELKTAYWEFRTVRADLLPEVNLTGTLPNYNKSYSSYQNSDGSYGFVRNNTLGLTGDLSIDQNIWLTGGKLSLTSSLDYIKQLGAGGDRHFMSVPVTLQLTQPIFGVNNIKWNRRIEPVRYAEAKAAFITATEEVTMRAITYYFNLLLAKENLGTAKQNQTNADHLYEVALAKRKMGQISENELLQLKLSALNAKAALTEKFIKELHSILKTGTSDSRKDWFNVGEYKKLPNEVGGKETAKPEDVATKIKALLKDYNQKEEHTLEEIIDFHYSFETIHPFQDGNGRVGRLIMFKECLKNNIVPFIIDEDLKMFYYRGLSEWNNEKGYLTDTCLAAQDKFKKYLDYFKVPYIE